MRKTGIDANCYCHVCGVHVHHRGIATHRSAHRRKRETCIIRYTNGITIKHIYTDDGELKQEISPMPEKPQTNITTLTTVEQILEEMSTDGHLTQETSEEGTKLVCWFPRNHGVRPENRPLMVTQESFTLGLYEIYAKWINLKYNGTSAS